MNRPTESKTMEKLRAYQDERRAAMELSDARLTLIVKLIPELRREGYSMEILANELGVTRQTLYSYAA